MGQTIFGPQPSQKERSGNPPSAHAKAGVRSQPERCWRTSRGSCLAVNNKTTCVLIFKSAKRIGCGFIFVFFVSFGECFMVFRLFSIDSVCFSFSLFLFVFPFLFPFSLLLTTLATAGSTALQAGHLQQHSAHRFLSSCLLSFRLSCCLLSFLPSFLPFLLPSFLPSLLA